MKTPSERHVQSWACCGDGTDGDVSSNSTSVVESLVVLSNFSSWMDADREEKNVCFMKKFGKNEKNKNRFEKKNVWEKRIFFLY